MRQGGERKEQGGEDRFRQSIGWLRAMDLCEAVYRVTRNFPKDELFGLTSQLRRAAVSIPSNIAEGQGRLSTGEMLQFFGHARGSLQEVQTQLALSIRLGYCTPQDVATASSFCDELQRILGAAITTLRKKRGGERL